MTKEQINRRTIHYCNSSNLEFIEHKTAHGTILLPINGADIGIPFSLAIDCPPECIEWIDIKSLIEDVRSQFGLIALRVKPALFDTEVKTKAIKFLMEMGFTQFTGWTSLVDLSQSRSTLWTSIRKSFKSLINKEKSKLETICLCRENFDPKWYKEWIEVYERVYSRSGKKLDGKFFKNQESVISAGDGTLMLSKEQNKVVGGAFFTHFGRDVYYASSALVPEIENDSSRYVGHHLLWSAIEYFKEDSFSTLEIGPIEYHNQLHGKIDAKKRNITFFKLGMGGALVRSDHYVKFLEESRKSELFSKIENEIQV